jgi:hypothetical protein
MLVVNNVGVYARNYYSLKREASWLDSMAPQASTLRRPSQYEWRNSTAPQASTLRIPSRYECRDSTAPQASTLRRPSLCEWCDSTSYVNVHETNLFFGPNFQFVSISKENVLFYSYITMIKMKIKTNTFKNH